MLRFLVTTDLMLVRLWLFNFGGRMVLPLRPESEVTSEQESKAKDGDLFSAERSQFKVKTE